MTNIYSRSASRPSDAAPADIKRCRAGVTEAAGPEADRRLVESCLSGDAAAWEQLYRRHHRVLLSVIRGRLEQWNLELSEEIAARVWYAVASDGGRLLERYDPRRGCRLSAYLAGIARAKMAQLFRSEDRRRRREAKMVRSGEIDVPQRTTLAEFEDFLETLTPREHEFFSCVLLEVREPAVSFSRTSSWQLSSRIRKKLQRYLRNL